MTGESDVSLFDRIGGDPAIAEMVPAFYARVLADPELRPFFEGVEIEKLERMQRAFFAAALGGPVQYTGRPLAEAHYGLGILPRHLRLFLAHLFETLQHHALSEQDAYDVVTRIGTYADEITGATTVDG